MLSSFLKYNWPSLIWALIILYLCMVPAGQLPKINIPNLDKMVHFTFYFTLAILMNFGWKKQTSFPVLHRNTLAVVFIIACIYGFAIEVMQETLTTTRHFELLDEAANATGAGTGSLIVAKLFNGFSVK